MSEEEREAFLVEIVESLARPLSCGGQAASRNPEEWPRSILVVVPCGTKVEGLGVAGFCDGLSNGRIGEIQDA